MRGAVNGSNGNPPLTDIPIDAGMTTAHTIVGMSSILKLDVRGNLLELFRIIDLEIHRLLESLRW